MFPDSRVVLITTIATHTLVKVKTVLKQLGVSKNISIDSGVIIFDDQRRFLGLYTYLIH